MKRQIEISPADKLEELKRRLNKAKKGFRLEKYDITEETMESVINMRSDTTALKEFVERNDIDPKKLTNANRSWITSAAFTFVSNGEEQGWKCARVAEFLYDFKKVPINQLAEQIRKLGGIEKIVRLAAEEDPRQLKNPGGIKKGSKARSAVKKNPFKSANAHKASTGDDADGAEDWDGPGDDAGPPGGEDSQIAVRISPALLAKLLAIKSKRRVKMIGVRIDTDDWVDVALEVQDVRRLKD
jgi:hypothetical protein